MMLGHAGQYAPATRELLYRVARGLMRLADDERLSPTSFSVPPLEPLPRAGCGVCAALVAEREAARAAGDDWTVRDRNRELGNCPHRRGTDRRPEADR